MSLKYRLDPTGRLSERSTASVNATRLLLSKVVADNGNEVIAIKDSNLMAEEEEEELGWRVLVMVLGDATSDIGTAEDG